MKDLYQLPVRVCLAGLSLELSCRYPETGKYFKRFLRDPEENAAGLGMERVTVLERAFADWESGGNSRDGFGEFCLLCQPVSDVLLCHDRCVFHAAALRFHGKAVLIAAGSGAGKSTHCGRLLEKHPEEFFVISGDKPVLSFDGKEITVWPSPWNGKEGLRGAEASPLGALVLLRRGEEDRIEDCSEKEAGVFTLPHVFQSWETAEQIRRAGAMAEKIVKSTRCLAFTSRDIGRSNDLLYEKLKEILGNDV